MNQDIKKQLVELLDYLTEANLNLLIKKAPYKNGITMITSNANQLARKKIIDQLMNPKNSKYILKSIKGGIFHNLIPQNILDVPLGTLLNPAMLLRFANNNTYFNNPTYLIRIIEETSDNDFVIFSKDSQQQDISTQLKDIIDSKPNLLSSDQSSEKSEKIDNQSKEKLEWDKQKLKLTKKIEQLESNNNKLKQQHQKKILALESKYSNMNQKKIESLKKSFTKSLEEVQYENDSLKDANNKKIIEFANEHEISEKRAKNIEFLLKEVKKLQDLSRRKKIILLTKTDFIPSFFDNSIYVKILNPSSNLDEIKAVMEESYYSEILIISEFVSSGLEWRIRKQFKSVKITKLSFETFYKEEK